MGDRAHPHGPGRAARLIIGSNDGAAAGTSELPLVPGDVVTLTEVWQGRALAVRKVRVVEDIPGRHRAFFLAPGSRFLNDPRDHGEVRFHDGPWELETVVRDRPVLSFAFPETPYAVLLSWSLPQWRFRGYYVNIQSPLRRRGDWFEYTDWFLDVRIPPTLDTHEWKDEHELEEAVERDLLTRAEARDVREAGERAIDHVLGRQAPFDHDWSSWRPDAAWGPLDMS